MSMMGECGLRDRRDGVRQVTSHYNSNHTFTVMHCSPAIKYERTSGPQSSPGILTRRLAIAYHGAQPLEVRVLIRVFV
jgi:hypothetical protein